MIHNDKELKDSQAALSDLYAAIVALKKEYGTSNPKAFQLLSEGPLQEIRRIYAEIEEYSGVALAESMDAGLWMRLEGEKARWRETSSGVLSGFLNALRKGVQTIVAFNLEITSRGRPLEELARACDFELVAFQPGSFKVGLRLPEPRQMEMFPQETLQEVQVALNEYLETATWVSSTQYQKSIVELFPDVNKRRVVLRAFKPIIPRAKGGVDYLELSGRKVPREQVLKISHGAVSLVTKALQEAVSEEEKDYVGDVREMDLDKKKFILRNIKEGGEVTCIFSEDMQPVAASYLGKKVRVIGVQSSKTKKLQVTDIDRETGGD